MVHDSDCTGFDGNTLMAGIDGIAHGPDPDTSPAEDATAWEQDEDGEILLSVGQASRLSERCRDAIYQALEKGHIEGPKSVRDVRGYRRHMVRLSSLRTYIKEGSRSRGGKRGPYKDKRVDLLPLETVLYQRPVETEIPPETTEGEPQ